MTLVIVYALLVVLSWGLTGVVRRYAIQSQLVDVPNERSSHNVVTPSGGGLAIVVVYLVGVVFLAVTQMLDLSLALAIAGGGSAVAVIGYIDDRRDISPLIRILVHIAAAIWLLVWVGGTPVLRFGSTVIDVVWLIYLLEFVGIVWCINLYNFMDGIDGLSGGQAVFVGVAGTLLFAVSGYSYGTAALMAVASAGFLLWNWPPARIFMGDVGSGFLGFIIASLIVISIHHTHVPILSWVMVMAVFVTDSTFTLLRRMLRGDKWYAAHRSHAYQNATQRFDNHLIVTMSVIQLNVVWLLPLAMMNLYSRSGSVQLVLTLLALVPIALLTLYFRAGAKQ